MQRNLWGVVRASIVPTLGRFFSATGTVNKNANKYREMKKCDEYAVVIPEIVAEKVIKEMQQLQIEPTEHNLQQIHYVIKKEYTEKTLTTNQTKNECVFVLGPMATGKTFYTKNTLLKKYSYCIYNDTDKIMTNFDEFSLDALKRFYPMARAASNALTDWYMIEERSFIAEGTCVKWEELLDFMRRLKNQHRYNIYVYFCTQEYDVIQSRSRNRARKVDEETLRKIYQNSMYGCENIKRHAQGLFQHYSVKL